MVSANYELGMCNKKISSLPSPQLDLVNVCQEIMVKALDFCGQKTNILGRDAIAEALKGGNRAAYEYFHYGLAKEIGNYLGSVEATVKAVYLFEPEAMPGEVIEEKPSLTEGVDLIAWVDGQKEALEPLVQATDEELLKEYKSLLRPATEKMRSLLTVKVIDDRDVQERVGYGALITSIYTRPIKVWSRFVIKLNADYCSQCGICSTICPFGAISLSPGATAAKIDVEKCQLCGMCYSACPSGAIESAYYDLVSLVRDVRASVRANGFKAIALTCRGSTPTAEEIEDIIGVPDFLPVCLPCVGRISSEFFLKALDMGIESIAVIPCKEDHCRFEDGSRIIRRRVSLLRSLLRVLGYDPDALIIRQAEGPIAMVDGDLCSGCGTCISVCPYGAISLNRKDGKALLSVAEVDPTLCQGCGGCAVSCPSRAIEMSRFTDQQMISQIEAALAVKPQNGAPRVLGFRCNWCSYGDADLPFGRLHYSQNIEVIRVPCVGRIDPLHILWASLNGADGVFLGGCHPEDCRYVSGGNQAEERISKLKELLEARGFDSRRLRLEWLKCDDPEAFSDAIRSFAFQIRKLGTRSIR